LGEPFHFGRLPDWRWEKALSEIRAVAGEFPTPLYFKRIVLGLRL